MERHQITRRMRAEFRSRAEREMARYQELVSASDQRLADLTRDAQIEASHEEDLDEIYDQEGIPDGYRRVMARAEEGEVDWREVMTGRTTDAEVFAAHLWLRPRLEVTAQAGHLIRDGHAPEAAWRIAREKYLNAEKAAR